MGRCLRCRADGTVEGDHWTGKLAGAPIDPPLVGDLCRACHDGAGRRDRALGLEPANPDPVSRLRRIAARLGHLASGPLDEICLPRSFLALVAEALAEIADLIADLLAGRSSR